MIDMSKIQELLQMVPKPPEESLPRGASDDTCDAFEQRTGICLPHDLRTWLKVTNGPCIGPGGLYGINSGRSHLDIEAYLKMFPSWSARKWIPVGGDGCGNHYVIPTQQEYGPGYPVLFVETTSSSELPSFIVASDVEHFLIALFEKELGAKGWPFNEAFVTGSDPQISLFRGIALPWIAH